MKIGRYTNCLLAGMLLSGLLAVSAAETASPKPDVLFIAIDDMNDWITLFDTSNPIQTPNLERLAARGCCFTRAYCTASACNPSRASIITGLRPETSKVYGNNDPWARLVPNALTLPRCFSQNGYDALGAGKIFHHGPAGVDRKDAPSFDEFQKLNIHSFKPDRNYNGYTDAMGKKVGSLWKTGWDWGEHNVPKQTDEYTVEYVNQVMAEHAGEKPLFLAAGIFRPHLPFWAPSECFARYPMETLSMPLMPPDDMDDVPLAGRDFTKTESFIWENTSRKEPGDPGSLKRMVQCYQAGADYADQMIGRLLDQLDATGRTDDTIIVLWSDHGYHLGDKNHCVKFTLWEKANHVPFIIVAPGVTTPGSRCGQPVSLVDIYPTLVELAGIECPAELDGTSLVPLLKDPGLEWERPALMTWLRGNHAVRSKTHRYICYADGTEELYADNDPWNITNLAGRAESAGVIAQLKRWIPQDAVAGGKPAVKNVRGVDDPDALVIADFEGETYGDWRAEGRAFGQRPAVADVSPPNKVVGQRGRGLVNTYLGGDGSTGTLTSPAFTIERSHISFLIGGGHHPGETCINLQVDGKTVRTATGRSRKDGQMREVLEWESWNVADLLGKKAVVQIVDRHAGGWGHINIDYIVQSNRRPQTLREQVASAVFEMPSAWK
jgi:arylsulfatase A-like enzyme